MTHKMRSILFSVPFVVLAGCESEVAPTGPSTDVSMARSLPSAYTAVDLDPVSSAFSKATGINPAGRIVGMTSGSVATRWWKGIATSLGNPGGCCIANAINSAGDIVGHSFLSGRARAFLWSNGVMSDLGSLGGTYSEAMALNAKRQVVGRSFTATGTQHAFLWEKGVIIDLGTLGGTSSIAYGINTAGQVVGYSTLATGAWHAFLWQSGTMTDLGTLGGCCSSAAGINSAGQVVGYSVVDNKFHAF
ncbi:MAG: hypothetical protein ACJ8AY_04330, partial [Gemmatimonadales bacterium]